MLCLSLPSEESSELWIPPKFPGSWSRDFCFSWVLFSTGHSCFRTASQRSERYTGWNNIQQSKKAGNLGHGKASLVKDAEFQAEFFQGVTSQCFLCFPERGIRFMQRFAMLKLAVSTLRTKWCKPSLELPKARKCNVRQSPRQRKVNLGEKGFFTSVSSFHFQSFKFSQDSLGCGGLFCPS